MNDYTLRHFLFHDGAGGRPMTPTPFTPEDIPKLVDAMQAAPYHRSTISFEGQDLEMGDIAALVFIAHEKQKDIIRELREENEVLDKHARSCDAVQEEGL